MKKSNDAIWIVPFNEIYFNNKIKERKKNYNQNFRITRLAVFIMKEIAWYLIARDSFI